MSRPVLSVERLIYLATLYRLVEGSSQKEVSHFRVMEEARLTTESGKDAFNYLEREKLIRFNHLLGSVRITEEGLKRLAAALKPLGGLPPVGNETNNFVNIEHVKEAQFNFGAVNSMGPLPVEELKTLMEILRDSLPVLKVDSNRKSAVGSSIEVLEKELESAQPKKNRIAAALSRIADALDNIPIFYDAVRFLLWRVFTSQN